MSDGVRAIRVRLERVLPCFTAYVRRDIEELIEIAARAEDGASMARGRSAHDPARSTLAGVLADILREANDAMTIAQLARAAGARGWATRAKDPRQLVRAALRRPPFARTRRGRYIYAPGAVREIESTSSFARAPSSVRARAHALLAASPRPMKAGEIARALLASGWMTKSANPAGVVSTVLTASPEFRAVKGGYVLRTDGHTPPPNAPTALEAKGERAIRGGLATRVHGLLLARGAPMTTRELLDALAREGWSTQAKAPGSVLSAIIAAEPAFVVVRRGVYALRDWPLAPASLIASAGKRKRSQRRARDEPGPSERSPGAVRSGLSAQIHAIVRAHGSPMKTREVVEALVRGGWKSSAKNPGSVVSAAVAAEPTLTSVGRGLYALAEWTSSHPIEPAETPRTPIQEPRLVPAADLSPTAAADLDPDLAFLCQHIEDARHDVASISSGAQRRQMTAWVSKARAIAERHGERSEAARFAAGIAADLATLAKLWWPGPLDALRPSTAPAAALRSFVNEAVDANLRWAAVAERLEIQIESSYDDPSFDDGWRDTRLLCDDERFATSHIEQAESVLARAGTPVDEPTPPRSSELGIGPKPLRELIEAARGLRWIRGVALDGLRWGRAMGRMRFIATTQPEARESALAQVVSAEYSPLGTGWGFDEEMHHEKRQWLANELPLVAETALPHWLARALDVFDNDDLASLLATRRHEIARIDLARLDTRRARARLQSLAESMGVSPPSPSTQEAAHDPENVPRFGTVRALLAERFGRGRTLFISNRVDRTLEARLTAAFDLEFEWCTASPRRIDAAVQRIRTGNYALILSASGFHTHAMDAAFNSAASETSATYVRVNTGRVLSCARAIHRLR